MCIIVFLVVCQAAMCLVLLFSPFHKILMMNEYPTQTHLLGTTTIIAYGRAKEGIMKGGGGDTER